MNSEIDENAKLVDSTERLLWNIVIEKVFDYCIFYLSFFFLEYIENNNKKLMKYKISTLILSYSHHHGFKLFKC